MMTHCSKHDWEGNGECPFCVQERTPSFFIKDDLFKAMERVKERIQKRPQGVNKKIMSLVCDEAFNLLKMELGL